MQPTSKKPWESKTLWFNLVALIGVVLVQVQAIPTIPQAWVPWLAAGVPVVNIGLRMITGQPLGFTGAPPTPLVYRPGVDTAAPPPAGVSFDTAPSAIPGEHNYVQPPDVATLPTMPGKEGPHDGQ